MMNRDEVIRLLRRFKKMNRHNDNIVRIGLFGSVARGVMGERSDIDIVVQLKTQDLFDLIGIKLDLEEQLHRQVDTVSYRERMNFSKEKSMKRRSMYDRELALEILTQIYQSTQTILKRFKTVKSVEDFTGSDAGMEKLDSICMQLIAIGEGLKNFDKVTDNSVLPKYPKVEWKKAKSRAIFKMLNFVQGQERRTF